MNIDLILDFLIRVRNVVKVGYCVVEVFVLNLKKEIIKIFFE